MNKWLNTALACVLAMASVVANAQRADDGSLYRHQLELGGMAVSRAWLVDFAYHTR